MNARRKSEPKKGVFSALLLNALQNLVASPIDRRLLLSDRRTVRRRSATVAVQSAPRACSCSVIAQVMRQPCLSRVSPMMHTAAVTCVASAIAAQDR
jgi:hypothetical protein